MGGARPSLPRERPRRLSAHGLGTLDAHEVENGGREVGRGCQRRATTGFQAGSTDHKGTRVSSL